MFRTVHLHGQLAELHSEPLCFDVDRPTHVLSALKSAIGGFDALLHKVNEYYFVLLDDNSETLQCVQHDTFGMSLGNATQVHLIPKTQGEGYEAAAYVYAALESYGTYVAAAAAVVTFIAVNYAIAMVAAALMPSPEAGGSDSAANSPSFVFNGAVNTIEEGYGLPLVYGELLTGSVVISVGYETSQIEYIPETAPEPVQETPIEETPQDPNIAG